MSDGERDSITESIRAGTRLLLVSNDAIRARRRPAAIVAVWLFEAMLALTIAWPATRAIASSYAERPDGDAGLFADGGGALLAWLATERAALSSITATVAIGSAIALVLGTVPLIMLLGSLTYTTQDLRAPRAPHLAPFVARSIWPMLSILGVGGLAQGALLAVALGASAWAQEHFAERLGEARAGQLAIAIFAVFMLVACVVGVLTDLTRAAVVRFRVGFVAALRSAITAFRRQKLVLFWSWAWRAKVGLLLLVGAALVSARLGGRPGVALFALMAFHQLVVLARVALRASWLARALRSVDANG